MTSRKDFYFDADIPKNFDPVEIWRDWNSDESIQTEQHRRIGVLRMFGSEESIGAARDLARCLNSDNSKCGMAACASCGHVFHRWIVANAMNVMAVFPVIYFLTWTPDPVYPPTSDLDFRIEQLVEAFLRHIERYCNENTVLIGMVELGWSIKLRCLVPHIHVVVAMETRDGLLRARPRKKKNRLIYRPLEVSKKPIPLSDRPRTFTYLGKVFPSSRRFPIYKSARNLALMQRAAELIPSPTLEVDWLLAMNRLVFADLMVLKGVSRNNTDRLHLLPSPRSTKKLYRFKPVRLRRSLRQVGKLILGMRQHG